jgi:hypothetical protein
MKKNLFLFLSLAMIIAFASCSNKEKQESESSNPIEEPVELMPVDQSAELTGNVGPGRVHMSLTIKGDLVEGEYYYMKYKSPLKLQGKLEEDGHLELHEVNKTGKPTGHFDGYYGKDYGYIGEFVNFQGSRFDFNLTIDDVTDNAGDGDGRGFLAALPDDSPARGGMEYSMEDDGNDFESYDYDEGYSESAGDSSIDDLLDSYESYVNRYIQFVKKAANGDVSAAVEYAKLYQDALDYQEKLENVKGEMSTAQMSRMNRINSKMIEAAQEVQ